MGLDLQTALAIKISLIRQSKMVVATISKKILLLSQLIDRFWRNSACWCVSTLSTKIANKISWVQKSKILAVVIIKIRKITKSLQRHDDIWYSDASAPFRHRQPIKFCKFDNPGTILKIWKMTICLLWIHQFRENLVWWCASILPTVSAYKTVCFKNSAWWPIANWKVLNMIAYLCKSCDLFRPIDIAAYLGDQISPKPQFLRAWIGTFQPKAPNSEMFIL